MLLTPSEELTLCAFFSPVVESTRFTHIPSPTFLWNHSKQGWKGGQMTKTKRYLKKTSGTSSMPDTNAADLIGYLFMTTLSVKLRCKEFK